MTAVSINTGRRSITHKRLQPVQNARTKTQRRAHDRHAADLGLIAVCACWFTHNFIPSKSMEPESAPRRSYSDDARLVCLSQAVRCRRVATSSCFACRKPRGWSGREPRRPGQRRRSDATRARQRRPPPFKANPRPEILIKRVIGLPGDKVHVKDNDVYINGKKLKEYVSPDPRWMPRMGYAFPYAVYEPLMRAAGPTFRAGRQPQQQRRRPVLGNTDPQICIWASSFASYTTKASTTNGRRRALLSGTGLAYAV